MLSIAASSAAMHGYSTSGDGFYDMLGAPLRLDAGVRFGKVFVGAYGSYDLLLGATPPCGATLSTCSNTAYGIRGGAELAVHLAPVAPSGAIASVADPWVGLGFGFQSLTQTTTLTQGSETMVVQNVRGAAEASLQVGLDLHVAPAFGIGLFGGVAYDAGQENAVWPMGGARLVFDTPLGAPAAPQEARNR